MCDGGVVILCVLFDGWNVCGRCQMCLLKVDVSVFGSMKVLVSMWLIYGVLDVFGYVS